MRTARGSFAASAPLAPTRRAVVAGVLVVLTAALSACTIITGPDGEWGREQRDLSRARRTWTSRGIDDYEFVVRHSCFCSLGGVAVRVIVQNHTVVAREIDLSGVPVPPTMAYLYPSIDGLFAIIQEAIDDRADDIVTSYDDRYGFPTDLWIDYDHRVADEERGYTLLRFRELP